MITIVDYGVGNLGSIRNMFKRVGVPVTIASDARTLNAAQKILLPGVGAFDHAMRQLAESGMRETLDRKALEERIPVFGVCLGMQLMTRGSEEGSLPGLGWVDATVRRIPVTAALKVPHMGWNVARPIKASALTSGLPDESRFYFVHSYYVQVDKPEDALLKTDYGLEFDSGFEAGNLYGAQFHPEKSHKFGMQLFKNFGAL